MESLDGLYDVFPGGLRNIWINRNFDELSDKIDRRDKLAKTLEAAETNLIKKCFKKHEAYLKKVAKKEGVKISKDEKKRRAAFQDGRAEENATGQGLTSGDLHQTRHTLNEALGAGAADDDCSSITTAEQNMEDTRGKPRIPIPVIGEGLQAAKQGISNFGRGIIGGLKGVNKGINNQIDTQNGFFIESDAEVQGRQRSATNRSQGGQAAERIPLPTPPPAELATRTTPPKKGGHDDWHQGHKFSKVAKDKPLPTQPDEPTPMSQTETLQLENPNAKEPQSKLDTLKKAVGMGPADEKEPVEYPQAFEEEFAKDSDDALWKKHLEPKDRETSRLPVKNWMPSLPLIGEKVDTIYYCRKEVARLNVEIEDDQANPERFPLMNSAFIQFNHQVAAHMACQSVSHHLPKQMAPRLVEIDPNDVIWNNMSIPWWQDYIRTSVVFAIVLGMIVLWAIPIAFTGSLSQLTSLAEETNWLHWVLKIPTWFRGILQGVLPPVLLGLLMFLLPIILRLLAKLQGVKSGMLVELSVQKYYFFFLFVQLFLVVSIASAATQIIGLVKNVDNVTNLPGIFATNIPKAANYFFSYMLLQAMSVSAGALVQVGGLIGWFILAPLLDSTARQKFTRQTSLSEVQWGTFFPVFTNLACIGLIYSVIAPLILIFNIITFTLFWFVYRYNTLYVTKFTRDTGGLLFPNAINTMFTGIYVMEFALFGMFLLVKDSNDALACTGQAIGMIVILILTIVFQWLLNEAFAPLFRYLPITLEDDAVRRDQEFNRAMHNKRIGIIENEIEGEDLQDELERRERQSREEDRNAEEYELQRIEADKQCRLDKLEAEKIPPLDHYEFQNPEISLGQEEESRGYRVMRKTAQATADLALRKIPTRQNKNQGKRISWADRGHNHRAANFGEYTSPSHSPERHRHHHRDQQQQPNVLDRLNALNPIMSRDIEGQQAARKDLSHALFGGINDELEDMTPEQRDALVQRAFQHSALRSRRPVIWIPRDELGVSDDEVERISRFSSHIWVSNVRQGLDSRGKCVYSGAPPDFSEVDLIQL